MNIKDISPLIILGAVIVIGMILFFCMPSIVDYFSGYDADFALKMESVKQGMAKQDVINKLGSPHSLTNGPSNELNCFYYENGFDSWGTYCFDQNDKVSVANFVGGT